MIKMNAKPKDKTVPVPKKPKTKNDFDWDGWESEARKRSAWGGYVQDMNRIQMNIEENEFQHVKLKGNIEKVQEIENRRKNRTPMLYIG